MIKKQLKKIINKKLQLAQNCKFKKAFIPKGWACVPIKDFSKELTDEIIKKGIL